MIVSWVNKQVGFQPYEKVECGIIESRVKDKALNLVYFGPEEGPLFKSFLEISKEVGSFWQLLYVSAEGCA